MNTRKLILVMLISLTSGVFAFAAARNAIRSPAAPVSTAATDPLFDWLGVSQSQRAGLAVQDAAFPEDLRKLRDTLATARATLATALENPATTDAEVQTYVEAVIAAGNASERRTMSYLLTVRHDLTADQQKKLFGLCAQGIREGRGFCWRQGGPAAGPGAGYGPGRGMGQGFRGGNGPGLGGGNGPGGGRNRGVDPQAP